MSFKIILISILTFRRDSKDEGKLSKTGCDILACIIGDISQEKAKIKYLNKLQRSLA